MKDLKNKTVRGGFMRVGSQFANFALRIGSLMVLARLLDPKDFGLVGMVTAFTGVLGIFREFGLSTASVQRAEVSEAQISTLFWINVLVGATLTVLGVVLAPVVVHFYHEPRLFWITTITATGLLLNSIGVQHSALLQRHMRFTALAVINTAALMVSAGAAIAMAKFGYGYWALVAMAIIYPAFTTLGCWLTTGWIPGLPRRRSGIRSMMGFGSTVTLNGLVVYIAYNLEKVLLGRYWGADAIGVYGRAYQLVNVPTDNLNTSIGEVAFAALARVQDDPPRLRRYFLKGYSLVLALTIPITVVCALFADDLIRVLLGPKWQSAVVLFRFLSPTILIFALINPFAWLLVAVGFVKRSLKIAFVIAPLVITGYAIGLSYGPKGVALGYSIAMGLWVVPNIIWCIKGTPVSFGDVVDTIRRPLLSGMVAAIPAFGVHYLCMDQPTVMRTFLEVATFMAAYAGMLLYAMGQNQFYLDLLRTMKKSHGPESAAAASV